MLSRTKIGLHWTGKNHPSLSRLGRDETRPWLSRERSVLDDLIFWLLFDQAKSSMIIQQKKTEWKWEWEWEWEWIFTSSPHSFISFLIPYATNTKAVPLIGVGVAEYIWIVVVQFAVPSDVRIGLCTTPPVTEAANVVVWAMAEAATAREGGKSRAVGSTCVGRIPIGGCF